jgi:predicted nucleic-acid-binding protein
MRGFYRITRAEISQVFLALAGIEHVLHDDRTHFLAAVDLYQQGLDFADALHMSRSARCSQFVSFDKAFVKRANALKLMPSVQLLNQ